MYPCSLLHITEYLTFIQWSHCAFFIFAHSSRLTRVLLCSYAWSRLFNLAKTYNKNLTPADVQQLSCNVLLSALSIMPYDVSDAGHTEAELDIEKDRSIRMATILGFKVVSSHPKPYSKALN